MQILRTMKKHIAITTLGILSILLFTAFSKPQEIISVKCMIQMVNYSGEGAYVVVSLLNPKGDYEKTLYVQGKDNEWYKDVKEWWKFTKKTPSNIDAISGETIAGGERTVSVLQIDKEKIDAGYRLRFETAVEDQKYYKDDLEFDLTTANLNSKKEGKGFIRYVRMLSK